MLRKVGLGSNLKRGNIQFSESAKYIATIENIDFKYKPKKNTSETVLKGDFLGDKINIVLKNNKKENLQRVFEVNLPGLNIFSK